ncbi:MAG: tRNA (adenosine(37)-N6)-threonylcarbamoyltransferase complex dimerization subunit type 1 TsaB [Verrucomicrobia bacterium]|nr:tRNA (adenosine(37)-N6)-threonylcarbamoyltransferase complex dimerization subunit type 1 TsaB [Verrucomicrobiota bacterium]
MTVLAIEFSSPYRTVAVVENGKVAGYASESNPNKTDTLALINAALDNAGSYRKDINRLAVGLGPGSYMGVRMSIAAVQGWQLMRQTECVGISSIQCILKKAQRNNMCGKLCIVIDAQRNEFYAACFSVGESHTECVEKIGIRSIANIQELQSQDWRLIGIEEDSRINNLTVLPPDAGTLGIIASASREIMPAETLSPIYLRKTEFIKAPPPRKIPEINNNTLK